MSSLWTPGGEHPVGREPEPQAEAGEAEEDPFAGLTEEQRAEAEAMAAQMSEVRQQLAEAPAAVVVANHAMGLYELAAIHLSQQPPKLDEARLAIDAFAALLGALEGRLGPDESTLDDALSQLRLAYVQQAGSSSQPEDAGGEGGQPGP